MLIGNTNVDVNELALLADERRTVVLPDALTESRLPDRISAYMDGEGGGGGDQRVRGLLYVDGRLVAASPEVTVSAGDAARWVDFPFYTFPDVPQDAILTGTGEVAIGIMSGTASNVIRLATSLSGGSGYVHTSTYSNGPLEYLRGYREEVLEDEPLFYWRLREATGAAANDETGGGVSGTHVGSPGVGYTTSVPVTDGRAVDYNGSTQYTSSTYSLTLEGAVHTLEAWVRRDTSSSADVIFATNTASTYFSAYLASGSDSLVVATGTTTRTTFASTGISNGAWHHVVLVVNDLAGTISLYVNGALHSLASGLSIPFGSAGNFKIAASGSTTTNALDGKLSEVAVYDYELPAERVAEHYTARTRTHATSDSAALPSLYAVLTPVWTPPGTDLVTDDYYAGLGYYSAQSALTTGVAPESSTTAVAGWHGTYVDPERGSFAVVKSDGPLADYVGERVRITNRLLRRSVVVLVHSESDLIAEDISLSRRAWLAIGYPSDDELTVRVEVLA